jgi:hypothetical protein
MATVHQVIYIPPLIGQWLLSMETSLSIEKKFNFDSDKTKNHPTRKVSELADRGAVNCE